MGHKMAMKKCVPMAHKFYQHQNHKSDHELLSNPINSVKLGLQQSPQQGVIEG
jgi:hypothetical protein